MDQLLAYERDARLSELETTIVEIGAEDARPWAVLADTILYPEGGGQPADRGAINGVAVIDVQRHGGTVRHLLAAPVALGPAVVTLDWPRRFDHMQQHTAQHLLTAVAHDRFGWPTTAFHLGEQLSDVELEVASPTPERLAELEEAVNVEVRAARAVSVRRVAPTDIGALAVRSRGLPADHSGDVRLVEIAGCDLNTCGGTHLASTAEIEAVALVGTEPMRGGTRVFFVAGGRLRRRLAGHERRNAALRALLGAPDGEITAAVEARLEQQRALERRARAAEEDLAEALAAALATRPDALVDAHLEGRDAAFLHRLARALAPRLEHRIALLTAAVEGGAFFVLAAGERSDADVPGLGRAVAAVLGGRGGGSGRSFQGKAPSLALRDDALARLRAALS